MPALRTAVARTATLRPVPGLAVHTGLDGLLAGYARQAAAARALLAVVLAGIAGTALGLLALAARLAVDRRRGELSLLRARGASRPRLVGRLAAEAALVVGPAVALGWAGARAVPGRGGTGWLPAVAALVTLAAVPLAVGVARLPAFPDRVVRSRPGPVRRTVEVTVCVLAAAGVLLARRRGIAAVGVDPYLAAVPALAGIAVGLVALRAYPWPVRALGRVAARGTGAATFLGLARAGRAPVGSALPLVVLVLAVGMGGFAGSVRAGLAAARDEAAVRLVGGDLRVSAPAFAPGEVDRVAHVPGVTAVAAGYLAAPSALHAAGELPAGADVAVLLLDVAAYERVLSRVGRPAHLPAALSAPVAAGAPVPAVVSPSLAGDARLSVGLDGRPRPVRVAGTVDVLPGLSRPDFVVLPLGRRAGRPVRGARRRAGGTRRAGGRPGGSRTARRPGRPRAKCTAAGAGPVGVGRRHHPGVHARSRGGAGRRAARGRARPRGGRARPRRCPVAAAHARAEPWAGPPAAARRVGAAAADRPARGYRAGRTAAAAAVARAGARRVRGRRTTRGRAGRRGHRTARRGRPAHRYACADWVIRSTTALRSRRSIAAAIRSGNASGVHANAGTPRAFSAAAFSWS